MRTRLRLQLHSAIYRPDSFVLMLRYCANLKAIRYESTNLNRIVAVKSHRVIVALTLPNLSLLLPTTLSNGGFSEPFALTTSNLVRC